jgi:type IV pilus assembly protein PilM
MQRRVLGLDVGSYAVKAVELQETLRGVEVIQLRQHPLRGGTLLADDLRDFALAHGFAPDVVVCAIAGDRVSSRRLSFPFRDARKIAQAVPFELEEKVPFAIEDVVIDWVLLGGDKTRADVSCVLAPRAEVAAQLETLRAAGLEPRVVEAEGLALGNLAALLEGAGTRLLLDIGHRKTTACLTVEGRPLAARTIPIAGRAISQAIARDAQVDEAEAERRKRERGVFQTGFDGPWPSALAILDRIAREVVRTLGSLEPILSDPAAGRIEEITLTGGSAHLHRLDEYLAERTGIPTRRFSVPPGPMGSALIAGGDPVAFGPAIALALRGTSRARTQMNFRQDEFAYRRDFMQFGERLRWTAVLGAAALALGIASSATSVWLESSRARGLEESTAELYRDAFPKAPPPAALVPAMKKEVTAAHDRAEFLGVYRGNLSALDLLTEISSRVPKDLDVVFEELSIDRQVVRIRGFTKSFEAVDKLRAELATYQPFSEIRVSEIQNDSKRGGKTFSVTISLGPGGEAA